MVWGSWGFDRGSVEIRWKFNGDLATWHKSDSIVTLDHFLLPDGTRMTRIKRIFTDKNEKSEKISVNPLHQRHQRANP